MKAASYDANVIGTGQSGPYVTSRLAAAGMKVAVIERKVFGGTCVNTGCIPTKTMVASAYAARVAARAAEYGVEVGPVRVDMKRVKARKDEVSKEDPDIALHGGYPRGRMYLARKLAKDLAGLTAWKTYAYFFGAPAVNADTNAAARPLDDTSPRLRRAARRDRWGVLAFHVTLPVVAFTTGWGWYYVVLWIVPLATVLQVIFRLRAICEHGALTDHSSPLTAARTNLPNWWQRYLLFPHHVNYHIEHHLYPAVPHYNLPRLHVALGAHGILERAEIRRLSETLPRIFADRAVS